MAKQKISTVGIIVVVGFIAFILALGGGFFKNFAIQNNGLDVTIPTSMNVDGVGSQFGINYNIVVNSQMYNYFEITVYVDGEQYLTQPAGSMTQSTLYMAAPSNGQHTIYLHVEQIENPDVWGNSNDMIVYVGETGPTPVPTQSSPTPTPTPAGSVVTLTISVSGGHGTTDWAPGSYQVQVGSIMQITAIPDEGYHVDKWSSSNFAGGTWSTANQVTFTIHGPTHIIVSFYSNSGGPTPTPYYGAPTPTPTPGGNIMQQITNWLNSIWQSILAFLRGFGINI